MALDHYRRKQPEGRSSQGKATAQRGDRRVPTATLSSGVQPLSLPRQIGQQSRVMTNLT